MKRNLSTALIAIVCGLTGSYVFYNYVPLSIAVQEPINLGSTITTINGSDTISSSRSVINTNFSNLNTDKLENGSTAATLSIGSLTVGSLTSTSTATSTFTGGVQALRINSTGTSTMSGVVISGGCFFFNNQCLGATTVSSVSNANGTLTISPTTGDVVASLNLANANTWTGLQTFGSTTATHATSTNAAVTSGRLSLNGLYFTFPSVQGASSTVFATNGSGLISMGSVGSLGAGHFLGATTTNTTSTNADNTETTIVSGLTIPGGIMGTNGAVKVRVNISQYTDSAGNSAATFLLKLGGTQACNIALDNAPTSGGNGYIDFLIFNNASASAQVCIAQSETEGAAGIDQWVNTEDSSAINTASSQAITVTSQFGGGDTNNITVSSAYLIFLGRP